MLNLAHFLDVTAQAQPDKNAIILDNSQFTWAQIAYAARQVATILEEKGVGPGDRVALMMANTQHFPIIYYGILHTGAAVVPINIFDQHHEIEHCLSDAGVTVFFVAHVFEEEARRAFLAAESCRDLIVVPEDGNSEAPVLGENFNALMKDASGTFTSYHTRPEDTAVILYTSGTTGTPKGAVLTHFNIFFNAYYVCHHIFKATANDVILGALPFFHAFGQTCLMNASMIGGTAMTLLPRFDPEKAMKIIARDKVTLLALVPTMYYFILAREDWQDHDFSSIRLAFSGGAALSEELYQGFQERYQLSILQGYGLSETSPVASINFPDEERSVGSIGKAIWGVEMGILRDDGEIGRAEEIGEIIIRGHNVMKQYLNRPQATRDAIVDGWFRTGDVGYYDQDGFFYIVDRKKDIIIRSGMNIYPREIEDALYGHPQVLEAAVVGLPDPAHGEEVMAYISTVNGVALESDELLHYLEQRIARYKLPASIEILDSLPKGPTGKILKRELKIRALRNSEGV